MVIQTAVDGVAVPSRPVEVRADLAARYDIEHVVLRVNPQNVFESFRAETDSAASAPPGPSGATYGRRTNRDERRAEQYSVEDGERHARGVVRDVARDTLDADDRDAIVRQGSVGNPVEEILAEVERRGATFLVIGGRKRSPAGAARTA